METRMQSAEYPRAAADRVSARRARMQAASGDDGEPPQASAARTGTAADLTADLLHPRKEHMGRPHLPAILSAAAAAAASAVLLALSPDGAMLDDTYIHLVFGRNLLDGGFMEFNPGEPSSGDTAPLWVPVAAIASLAGDDAPRAVSIASAALACLAVLAAGAAAPVLAATGPFLLHGTSGMETAAACLAVVILLRRLLRGGAPGLPEGLLLAAAVLLRPETGVLALPTALACGRRPCRLAASILPAAAACVLWAAWNLHSDGLPLPTTYYAKIAAGPAARDLLRLAVRLALSGPLMIPLALAGVVRLAGRRNPAALAAPLLLCAALATQPNPWFQLRYWVPFLAAAAVTAAQAIPRDRRWLLAAVVASSAPGAIFFASRRAPAVEDVGALDVGAALVLDSLAAPGDRIAASDIGAIAWHTGLRVMDLDGLVTPWRLPGGDRDPDRVLAEADWLAAFPSQHRDLVLAGGDRLETVACLVSTDPVICGDDTLCVWRISRPGTPMVR